MSEKNKTVEKELSAIAEIERLIQFKSDLRSAEKGHRIHFKNHVKKESVVSQGKSAYKSMFAAPHSEEVAEKPKFYKTKSIVGLLLEGIMALVFIFLMFTVSNLLWIPLLSENVQFIAKVATLVFSGVVVWKS